MSLLDASDGWRILLAVLAVFGFAPGAVLRAVVRVYPRDHPRRRELLAELYALGYRERPFFVAQQLETALFEGLPARWRRRRQAGTRAGDRLHSWWRTYLPPPEQVTFHQHLDTGEYVIHVDHPSLGVVAHGISRVGIIPAAGLTTLAVAPNEAGAAVLAGTTLMAAVVTCVVLRRRLGSNYPTHIVTNRRLIRLRGVADPVVASIPWDRVVGLRYQQTSWGRVLGYATTYLDIADEPRAHRFAVINDPATFHQRLVDTMLAETWSNTPRWRQPPTAPSRGERRVLFRRKNPPRPNGASGATTSEARTRPLS